MATKAHVNLTLDPAVVRWVDMDRGQTPRSTFINQVLQKVSVRCMKDFHWAEEAARSDKDIAQGRVKAFKTASEAVKWLKS